MTAFLLGVEYTISIYPPISGPGHIWISNSVTGMDDYYIALNMGDIPDQEIWYRVDSSDGYWVRMLTDDPRMQAIRQLWSDRFGSDEKVPVWGDPRWSLLNHGPPVTIAP